MDVAILPSAKVIWIRAAVHTGGGTKGQHLTKPNCATQQCLLAPKMGAFGKTLLERHFGKTLSYGILTLRNNYCSFQKNTLVNWSSALHICLCQNTTPAHSEHYTCPTE